MINSEFDKIIQFSIPRSGSTFVTQILKDLLPKIKIMKVHNCVKERGVKVVVTIRDFRDVLTSNWRVMNNITFKELSDGRKPTDEEIKIEINRTIFFIEELHKMIDYYGDQMTILKYKNFYKNHDYLYDRLEGYLAINISIELRQELSEKYGIKANRERADKLDSFRNWDSSGIHGNHIFKGEVGGWKEIIKSPHHAMINDSLQNYLERWKYQL
jgi:hypothetical protein